MESPQSELLLTNYVVSRGRQGATNGTKENVRFRGYTTPRRRRASVANKVRISPGLFQPIAADDVAANVADVALAAPRNGIVEIAGPERAPFDEFVARYLKAVGDPRQVVSDPEAKYFGGRVRAALACPAGRGAPRPHRFRRMASPLTGSGLIRIGLCAQGFISWYESRGDERKRRL